MRHPGGGDPLMGELGDVGLTVDLQRGVGEFVGDGCRGEVGSWAEIVVAWRGGWEAEVPALGTL
jgi:hypothetical protein